MKRLFSFWKRSKGTTKVSPTSGPNDSPATGVKACPTTGADDSPPTGVKICPTTGANDSLTTGVKVSPTTGANDSPATGVKVSPTTGANDSLTTGVKVSPTTGANDSPATGVKVFPTTGANDSPATGVKVFPTTGANDFPATGVKVFPTTGANDSLTTGVKVFPTTGANDSPATGVKVSPTTGANDSLTTGVKVSPPSMRPHPLSGGKVFPSTGVVFLPKSRGKVFTPASQGFTGINRRRPIFREENLFVIHKAAKDNNLWRMKLILLQGHNVNERDKIKRTALHVACASGHVRMARLLIQRGCHVDLCDALHKSALMQALEYENTSCAHVLLDCGADANITDIEGNTALHYAVCGRNPALVERLLSFNANTEARNKDGCTPLDLAKRANKDEMVKVLISRGVKQDETKSKEELTSEEKGPQQSESCTPVTDQQATQEQAGTERKSTTVVDTSNEDALSRNVKDSLKPKEITVLHKSDGDVKSQKKLTSECKEEKGPQKSESRTSVVTDLQKTRKEAWAKTNSMTVIEVSKEDALISNKQLSTEYKEENEPQKSEPKKSEPKKSEPKKSESRTPVIDLQKTQKGAWTEANTTIVIDISKEDALISNKQLTAEHKEENEPQKSEPKKSENRTPVIDLQKTQKGAWTEANTTIEIEVSSEDSSSSKQPLTSKYKEGRGPQKSEGRTPVVDISEEDALSSMQQLIAKYKEERKPPKFATSTPDLPKTRKQAQTEVKSRPVVDVSEEDSLSSIQQLIAKYKEERPPKSETITPVADMSEETLSSIQQLIAKYKEERPPKSETITPDLPKSQKLAKTEIKSRTVLDILEEHSLRSKPELPSKYKEERRPPKSETVTPVIDVSEEDPSSRLFSKPGTDDIKSNSRNEDWKEQLISETHTLTAKTSKHQSKRIHLPWHLENMSQESRINRACDQEDTSVYSGDPSVQNDEEMRIKQGTSQQRKNLQLSKDESKHKSHKFSVRFKITDYPEEEPVRDNSKEGASLRQMPSNFKNKMLDWEGKDAFGKFVSAALQTFPEREETLKIVSPSHADPGFPEETLRSSSELCSRGKELHFENDKKPDADHVLNKNEERFYNETEYKKVRTPGVMSGVKDQEFAPQMTTHMNPCTADRKLGMGPTPQPHDPKSHPELQHPRRRETKLTVEIRRQDVPAVTNTYKATKPNQDLFQSPLRADNFNANNCTGMDSQLKDESSFALHDDGLPGRYVIEELQQYTQRFKKDKDMFQEESLVWKKKIVHLQKEDEEEKKKQKRRKVSGNLSNAADAWSRHSKAEQTAKQQLPAMENEDADRFTLKEEEDKKRQKGDLLYEKYTVQLRKKEDHFIKEVKMNSQRETTIRAQEVTLAIIRENEVSESSKKEKSLLHKNHMLWDEIAKLRLEMDTIKNQTQEMKKYFEDIAVGKEKQDDLEKTVRESEFQHNAQLEVLRADLMMLKTTLENEQRNRRRLDAKFEAYRYRLDAAMQDHDHCHTSSKRDLELAFQGLRDEWHTLWNKMNLDISSLKHNNEILFHRLSQVESKTSRLESELHHARDALQERTLALEAVEGDLGQKRYQKEEAEHVTGKEEAEHVTGKEEAEHVTGKEEAEHVTGKEEAEHVTGKEEAEHVTGKEEAEHVTGKEEAEHVTGKEEAEHVTGKEETEHVTRKEEAEHVTRKEETEHVSQKQQGEVDKDPGKLESLEERLSQLQTEVKLIEQRHDRAPNKADREENMVINIEDQIRDIVTAFDQEYENYILGLQALFKEVINEWHHFEIDSEKRDVIVRQCQKELADTQKKLSTVEASLEIESYRHMHLEDKKPDFKKRLNQTRRQNDGLLAKLPPSSSTAERTPQQESTVDALLKEYKEIKAGKEKRKEMAGNLRPNEEMAEDSEFEKYKMNIEKHSKDIAHQLSQLELYLQRQSN